MRVFLAAGAGAAALLAGCNNSEVDVRIGDNRVQVSENEPDAGAKLAEAIADTASRRGLGEKVMAGQISPSEAVATYLEAIEVLDHTGPALQSVLALNPSALDDAKAGAEGALGGLPILIKDNIETKELPTTAGSLALADNDTGRDAPAVARLRSAGAIILGKTNLSEWANFRSSQSSSGWSGMGGQTKNPHDLRRSPCGSSSGSGAAVAAGLAWAALGSETNGSVICPSAFNGIVGFKPTVGLVPRTHVVPISPTQDTIGPMTTSVADAALLLTVMAGSDPADPATVEADARKVNYVQALGAASLSGVRLGVLNWARSSDPREDAVFDQALARAEAEGAILVDIDAYGGESLGGDAFLVLKAEFKDALDAYLRGAAPTVTVRTLSDLIAFNAETPRETELFGQDILIDSQATGGMDDADYQRAVANTLSTTGPEGIDRLLSAYDVELLVAPSTGPAFLIDPVRGDIDSSDAGAGWLAAIAGYPHLTVPMGGVGGLPLGLSIIGTKWDDAAVLRTGQAFEDILPEPLVPTFRDGAATDEAIAEALKPFE
ncbi:MAG: amidase [Pseudomonadota bacterium]